MACLLCFYACLYVNLYPRWCYYVSELNSLLTDELEAFLEDVKLSDVTSDFDDGLEPKDPVAVLQGHAKQLKHRLSGALVRNMESLVKLMSKDEVDDRGADSFDSTTQVGYHWKMTNWS